MKPEINARIIREIRDSIVGEVIAWESLSRHTTYRSGGKAQLFVQTLNSDEAKRICRFARKKGFPLTVIGAGSNVIVPDLGIGGIVLKTMNNSARIQFEDNKVTADAGVYLDDLIRRAASRGLGGLQHVTGIPGTVGGAIVMNAGTRGGNISDIICWAEAVDPHGNIVRFEPLAMGFRYRGSLFQEKGWLVLRARFDLVETDPKEAIRNIDRVWSERAVRYPMDFPNAGSVFRNPEGLHAARLIQESGCKGLRVGDAVVSEKHANFIINTGSASSNDIIRLVELVRKRVYEQSGIQLELEQKILPSFTND